MPALTTGGKTLAIVPQSFSEIVQVAGAVIQAGMNPKSLDTTAKCTVAIMHGLELGLTPMAALQSIAVVNGNAAVYGDGMLALVRGSGLLEDIQEDVEWEKDGPMAATCKVKRKGEASWGTHIFTRDDAMKANLWKKVGPWTQYPQRMLAMRARAWALRDKFADVLRGLHSAEEMEDMVDITPQATATTGPAPAEPQRNDPKYQQPAEGTPHADPPPAGQDAGKRDAASGGGGDSASAQPGPDTKPAEKPKGKKATGKPAYDEKASAEATRREQLAAAGVTDVVDENEAKPPVVEGEIDTEIKFERYTSAGKFYDFSDVFLQSEATTPAQARAWRAFYHEQIEKLRTHERETVRGEINDTLTLYLKKVGVAPDPQQEREPGEEG
jgi:hypothetical protein